MSKQTHKKPRKKPDTFAVVRRNYGAVSPKMQMFLVTLLGLGPVLLVLVGLWITTGGLSR